MDRFALGHAAGADWRKAARGALGQLAGRTERANLGFVYVTHELGNDLGNVLALLKSETGVANWVGAAGIGICASGHDYFGEPAVAALASRFPAGSFGVFDTERDEGPPGEASPHLSDGGGPTFGIVHGDPGGPEILRILPHFAEATRGFLVGGLSSPEATQSQVADGVTGGGLSGVLFSSEVPVATGLAQGCQPIGPMREITECSANVAIEVDGKPALEVLRKDIEGEPEQDVRRIGGSIFVAFPVEGSDRGDYMVRNLVGIDEARSFVGIGAPLQNGQRIMFCRRDADSARADLRSMLKELHGRAGDAIKGGVYCSCVARGPNLFGPGSVEPTMIAEELGDIPLIGFYGSGEISHNRLYTQTGVLALFL